MAAFMDADGRLEEGVVERMLTSKDVTPSEARWTWDAGWDIG